MGRGREKATQTHHDLQLNYPNICTPRRIQWCEVVPIGWTGREWFLVMVWFSGGKVNLKGRVQGRELGSLPALPGRRQAACLVRVWR